MKTTPPLFPFLLAVALSTTLGLVGCKSNAPQGDLQSAIKPRTEVTKPKLEVVKTDKEVRDQVAAVSGPKPQLSVDLGGGVTMDFVLIRPGSFTMGLDIGSGDDRPDHKVTLTKPFYLGKYEVTQEQWQAVMGSNPSYFKGPKLPVESVSWNDCQSFLTKLQEKLPGRIFALPTEAQWEYACRAGSTTKFSYGDGDGSLGEYAWFASNSGNTPQQVGGKKPNAWGLYDMHGNVWEWCADWHANSYPGGDATDPQGASSGSSRVLRGGAWSLAPGLLRSSLRNRSMPDYGDGSVGFRLLLGVESAR